ncbi:MAG: accessory factor UbiK family protein [bacterium]
MQTKNPIIDGVSRAINEAAGAADGVRREAETLMSSQLQRFLADQDLVPREEFEALQEMVLSLKAENEALKTRLDKLEK